MTGRNIILATGEIYEVAWCGQAGDRLNIQMADKRSVWEAAGIFSRPEATARIKFDYGEMQDVFDGFTELIMIQADVFAAGTLVQLRRA